MQTLRFKSKLLQGIREYFYQSGLIEVTTPVLRRFGANDPHLDSFHVPGQGYLQTSPEHAMKCLLAEHQCSLFQICPAFRQGEAGARHLPEFLMLEWYQCGFTLAALMDDVAALLSHLDQQMSGESTLPIDASGPVRVSYRALFEQHFSCNPHQETTQALRALVQENSLLTHLDHRATRADCLDALFAASIEPTLLRPTIVFDFPACQAALATIETSAEGDSVSQRFELYAAGVELANAYQELNDAEVLERRFEENNRIREAMGKAQMPADRHLLDVIAQMPACAGIALGIDRLVMVMLGRESISG